MLLFFFSKILFIHERQRHRQREKQTSCGEPDAGLNPRNPGLLPESKADTQSLSHPGTLILYFQRREELMQDFTKVKMSLI